MKIVCAGCKWDQFRLVAQDVDARGRGVIRAECVRCGGAKVAGIDPRSLLEMPVKAFTLEPPIAAEDNI